MNSDGSLELVSSTAADIPNGEAPIDITIVGDYLYVVNTGFTEGGTTKIQKSQAEIRVYSIVQPECNLLYESSTQTGFPVLNSDPGVAGLAST